MESDSRERVEEERQREQRARAEMIRQHATQAPAPTPTSSPVVPVVNDEAEVQRLREAERQRLESMQQTVHLDASRETFEQTFYT